jgi:hypothetical protein
LHPIRGFSNTDQIVIRIRWVEIPTEALEHRKYDLDGDEDFIRTRFDSVVISLPQLEAILLRLGIEPTSFGFPHLCELPF